MKKGIILIILSVLALNVAAVELSKVAVVDITAVYKNYYRESSAMKDIAKKTKELNTKLASIQLEIDDLMLKKEEANMKEDKTGVLYYEEKIDAKLRYKQQYNKTMVNKIKQKQSNVYRTSKNAAKIYSAITFVAESGGYSMIIRKNSDDLIWSNDQIDITDLVLEQLKR